MPDAGTKLFTLSASAQQAATMAFPGLWGHSPTNGITMDGNLEEWAACGVAHTSYPLQSEGNRSAVLVRQRFQGLLSGYYASTPFVRVLLGFSVISTEGSAPTGDDENDGCSTASIVRWRTPRKLLRVAGWKRLRHRSTRGGDKGCV